ncbi:MAG: magnesium-translocating P-type ATPase [Kiritimatiellaeota bacterium]|nr:magnesium-translocating P-type ATPase [Kiritimatiellota bacterium]
MDIRKTMPKTAKELEAQRKIEINARLVGFAGKSAQEVVNEISDHYLLTEKKVEAHREQYGANKVHHQERKPFFHRLLGAFINPFTVILLCLAAVSFVTDIYLADAGQEEVATVVIIITMVLISGTLRFVQETRSGNAAARLSEMVKTTATVERRWTNEDDDEDESGNTLKYKIERREIPLEEIVVGDVVHLSAGDMIPADVRITKAKDLFVSQAALTGESEPVEKTPDADHAGAANAVDLLGSVDPLGCKNLGFMGSNVVSGSATAVVVAVGNDTYLGNIAKSLSAPETQTAFDKGINSVSWVLIRFMLVMVPVVFFMNGITKGDWMNSFLFAITVAVGLTPEMLPMIVTTCLAKGAVAMSKKKAIIKRINSIQNFGAMNILCTDKTGTLTQDRIILEYHMDVLGNDDPRVLYHAFLNSYYQTGLKNLIDIAVIQRAKEDIGGQRELNEFSARYVKVDEIPFDFERRRMSVVVLDSHGDKTQMITKGAVEEMLAVCSMVEIDRNTVPLTAELRMKILATVEKFNDDGMRVIALAQKNNPPAVGAFSVADETDMTLIGYLALLDPPKLSAGTAIAALKEYGVSTKVLTGDNDKVARCICRQVGLGDDAVLLGTDIEEMDDATLAREVERTNIFAKLSPHQKTRIVQTLRDNGNTVGFMGDGINDASAMKAADVGISVDTAVDIAKESADIILLEKDLMVLENGIVEGRKTFANMTKYIMITASSNFGNMFSVVAAAVFLPFLPMIPLQIIFLNLIYDISCTAIPWDNVDAEQIRKARRWDPKMIGSYMRSIGPISSLFDITTYLLMFFLICPMAAKVSGMELIEIGAFKGSFSDWPEEARIFAGVFWAGWFVESMWTQTLVIHMLRTPKIPFIRSRASFPLTIITFIGIAVLTAIPFTPIGTKLKMESLPGIYFGWLALTVVLYLLLAQWVKHVYIKKHGDLL